MANLPMTRLYPVAAVHVALLDDAPLVAHGLRSMLQPYAGSISLSVIDAGTEPPRPVDVTLYDCASVRSDGVLARTLTDPAKGSVVMYSLEPSPTLVTAMLDAGCAGFVDKKGSVEELIDVITTVARLPRPHLAAVPASSRTTWPGKGHGLSRRESEVLGLIARGLTNEDISAQMYLSINTVKTYIRSAYRKLGVTRRAQAVRWGIEHGLNEDQPCAPDRAAEGRLTWEERISDLA